MSNFEKNQRNAKLALSRYDFQSHVDGDDFRHKANTIDLNAPLSNLGNASNVQIALENINEGMGLGAVVFDFGTPKNLRANRPVNQSPINGGLGTGGGGEKHGCVNLSNDTSGSTVGITGDFSTIVGGDQNEILLSEYSFIGGGLSNRIDVEDDDYSYNVIGGGRSNQITYGSYVTIAGGRENSARESGTVGGGAENTAFTKWSTIPGGYQSKTYLTGQLAFAAGAFESAGDCQISTYIQKGISDNGSVIQLTDPEFNEFELKTGSAYAITAKCLALRTDAPGVATWTHELLVRSNGTASIIDNDEVRAFLNGQSWTIVYSAVGNSIIATFTGTSGHNIRVAVVYDWVEINSGE